jgi:hypothetical protein
MKNILSSISQFEKNRILEMHRSATRKNYLFEQALPLPSKSTDNKTGNYFALLQGGEWDTAEASNNLTQLKAGTYNLSPATDDPKFNRSFFIVDSQNQFTGFLIFFKYDAKDTETSVGGTWPPTAISISDDGGYNFVGTKSDPQVDKILEKIDNTYPKEAGFQEKQN